MDFLDKLAYWLTPKSQLYKDSDSESTTEDESVALRENANEEEDPINTVDIEEPIKVEELQNIEETKVSHLKIKRRANFAEVNYKAPDKVYNDNYGNNNPYHRKKDKEFFLEKILPFLNTRQEWAEWVYHNRYGVFTTVALYLSVLLGFSMVTFDIGKGDVNSAILIDIHEDIAEELEDEVKRLQEERDLKDKLYDTEVSNKISDENSETKEDYEEEYEKVEYIDSEKLLQDANEAENAVYQNMAAYNAGVDSLNRQLIKKRRIAKATRDSLNRVIKKEQESNFTRKKGNVTVSYDLDGRHAIFLEIPAYLCEGGGKVVIDMVVNRMGKVISATVKKTYGVTDLCVEEMAIWATTMAEFNMSENAPVRQKGTMTYIFVEQ